MNARDPYLHENLTPDQISMIEESMRNTVIDGIPLDPRDTVSNPDKFNDYPFEMRRRLFEKLPEMAPDRAQFVDMATGEVVPTTREVAMNSNDIARKLIMNAGITPDSASVVSDVPQQNQPAVVPTETKVPNQVEANQPRAPQDIAKNLIMNAGTEPAKQPKSFASFLKAAKPEVGLAKDIAGQFIYQPAVEVVGRAKGLVESMTTPGAYASGQAPKIAEKSAAEFIKKYGYEPSTIEGQAIAQGLSSVAEAAKVPPAVTPELAALGPASRGVGTQLAARGKGGAVIPSAAEVPPAATTLGEVGRVEPTMGKPRVSYAEFQQQLQEKRGGATVDLQSAFEAKKMPSMEQTGANPYFGKFTGEEKARGQFPQIKESKMANDVPESEQAFRAQVVTEILGDQNVRPGVITGNEQTLRNEYAMAKKAGDTPSGAILRDKIAQEQNALSNYALARVEQSGANPNLISPNERGAVINNFFSGKTEPGQTPTSLTGFFAAEKRRLYDEAQAKVGANPITTKNVDQLLANPQFQAGLKLTGNEKVASGAKDLIRLARTVGFQDEFGQFHAPNTIGAWDAVRKSLNSNWTKENAKVIRTINKAIDDDIASAGGQGLIKRADQLHQMEKDILGSKGIKTIFGEIDSNGVETGRPLDTLPKNLNELPFSQWKHIYDTADKLTKGTLAGPIDPKTKQPKWTITVPEEVKIAAQQAKNEMLGSIAREVYEAGAGKAGAWNQNATNKVLNARADKIRYAFPLEEQKAFNKLNYGGYFMPGIHSYEGAALQERRLGVIEKNLPRIGMVVGGAVGTAVGGPGTASAIGGYIGEQYGSKRQVKKAIKVEQKRAQQLEQEMKKSGGKAKTIPLKDIGKGQ